MEILNSLHIREEDKRFANFWCTKFNQTFSKESIQISSVGWELVSTGIDIFYEFKFLCKTDSKRFVAPEWNIVRRFSDFDVLCNKLLRTSHIGSVLPPLPPKFYSVDERVASQRARDLSLFLNFSLKNIHLLSSFEVKVFLESSSNGLKHFKQLYVQHFTSFCHIIDPMITSEDDDVGNNWHDNSLCSPRSRSRSLGFNENEHRGQIDPGKSDNSMWRNDTVKVATNVLNNILDSSFEVVKNVAPSLNIPLYTKSDVVSLSADIFDLRSTLLCSDSITIKNQNVINKCLLRTEKLHKLVNKCEILVSLEKNVLESYDDLASHFYGISELEGTSSNGHVSAGFDSLTFSKCLRKYTYVLKTNLAFQYNTVLSKIRILSKYKDSIQTTLRQKNEYKKSYRDCETTYIYLTNKLDQAKIKSKIIADEFSKLSNTKSQHGSSDTTNSSSSNFGSIKVVATSPPSSPYSPSSDKPAKKVNSQPNTPIYNLGNLIKNQFSIFSSISITATTVFESQKTVSNLLDQFNNAEAKLKNSKFNLIKLQTRLEVTF